MVQRFYIDVFIYIALKGFKKFSSFGFQFRVFEFWPVGKAQINVIVFLVHKANSLAFIFIANGHIFKNLGYVFVVGKEVLAQKQHYFAVFGLLFVNFLVAGAKHNA